MSAYIVAVIDEHDSKVFEQYRQAALPVVTRYGGRSLLQGTQYITFPTSEAAQAFYHSPEYTESRKLRYQSSKTDMLLFEGRPA
jgi:uncharacterized protein (DUF1330 family)